MKQKSDLPIDIDAKMYAKRNEIRIIYVYIRLYLFAQRL